MIRGMRIANAVLVVLVAVGGLTLFVKSGGDWTRFVRAVFGIGLLVAPFYFSWRALRTDSTIDQVRRARFANFALVPVFMAAVVLSGMGPRIAGNLDTYVRIVMALLACGLLLAVNVIALGRRKDEIDQANAIPAALSARAARLAGRTAGTAAALPASESAPAESALAGSANYFVRHWRGELSLPVAFWINGVVFAGIALAILANFVAEMGQWGASLRTVSLASLGVLLLAVAEWLWAAVGIWRSAGRHAGRGGSPDWAGAAKVMVVLGFLSMTVDLSNTIVPQVKELGLIAIGDDPIGTFSIKVSANRKSVIIKGTLREGSAAEIQKVLDATPSATSVVLDVNGGRLLEAQRIARAVQSRGLDTYVESQCDSACTFVFLAGKDRAATANAKIGFHQPSFVGLDASAQRQATESMLDLYRAAGLPDAFIQRIGQTPSSAIWYPTEEELLESRVVTRISPGGESDVTFANVGSKEGLQSLMRGTALWTAIEKRLPHVFAKAADRAWNAKMKGGTDVQVGEAMRSTLKEVWQVLRTQSDDFFRERVAELVLDEMKAARNISYVTCAYYMSSQVDVTNELPAVLRERELALLLDGLAADARVVKQQRSRQTVIAALREAIGRMPTEHRLVLLNPKQYENQSNLYCDATIALFESVLWLRAASQAAAIEGLLTD